MLTILFSPLILQPSPSKISSNLARQLEESSESLVLMPTATPMMTMSQLKMSQLKKLRKPQLKKSNGRAMTKSIWQL